MSQTLRDLSSEAVRRYLPPGCQDIPLTQLSCPSKLKRHNPVLTSQTFTDLSLLPLARKGPTWEKLFLLSPPAAAVAASLIA